MPADHNPSKEESERTWMREQISQIPELRIALDNMFQQVATLARLSKWPKITPERFVRENQNRAANFAFLMACMQEETRLMTEAKANADKFAINQDNNAKTEETKPTDTDAGSADNTGISEPDAASGSDSNA